VTRREYLHSELTQEEKRDTLVNDRRVHKNTYFSHAHPDEGGRFATSDKPPRFVVGSTPAPQYPAGPNWSDDPTGVEPPTGVAIDQMEPVGTHAEIEQSLLREMRDEAGPPPAASPDSPNRRGSRSTRSTPSDVSSRPRRLSRRKG